MPFSNGIMFELFQHNVCEKCIHHEYSKDSDTYGCPLMDTIIWYSYAAKDSHKAMINYLIDGKTCKMFKPLGALGQKRLSE